MLTIIIPTYNCENYIDEVLASVLDQLPEEDECIVVDDGSTDGTVQKLKAREGLQENLRIYYEDHAGASMARNYGLELAKGEYVTFLDCDDCLQDGFLEKSRPLLDEDADLYIFGIRQEPLNGSHDFWTVADHTYHSVSEFADEYIRTRKLLIYSNCNKFYRKSIIDELVLRFEENTTYGEDRLFNYKYLTGCAKIRDHSPAVVTSSLIMLRYIQRSEQTKTADPRYLEQITRLHDEKMYCFLALSEGTTAEERQAFMDYDLSKEINIAREKMGEDPEE